MAANGVGTLKTVEGRLNAVSYVQLICRTLKQDGERLRLHISARWGSMSYCWQHKSMV